MARRTVTPPVPADQIAWGEIQRLVRSGYPKLPVARFLVGSIVDSAKAASWLRSVAAQVTFGDRDTSNASGRGPGVDDDADDPAGLAFPRAIQLAFTAAGLRVLGVTEADLAPMSRPFVEGMCTPHRQRLLGDRGESDPAGWRWGGPDQAVAHVLVLSYAEDGIPDDHGLVGPDSGIDLLLDETTTVPTSRREPFGFVDGVSRVRLAGTPAAGRGSELARRYSVVQPGEVVIGAVDEGDVAPPPPPELARNGTYLALRQLLQHVDRFDAYLAQVSEGDPDEAERIAVKMVGRNRDGTPLVGPPSAGADADVNAFGFAGVDGQRCPLGAHIRRANPRDDDRTTLESTRRHRILRRGRPYGIAADGTPTGVDGRRGLLFVALNADLERQFEFVQHNWLNNETFDRNGEVDPLTGTQADTGRTFTMPEDPVRRRVRDIPEFVTVEGGAYFLLPSRTALSRILASTT